MKIINVSTYTESAILRCSLKYNIRNIHMKSSTPCNFIKNEQKSFPVNAVKLFRTGSFQNNSGQLLLYKSNK